MSGYQSEPDPSYRGGAAGEPGAGGFGASADPSAPDAYTNPVFPTYPHPDTGAVGESYAAYQEDGRGYGPPGYASRPGYPAQGMQPYPMETAYNPYARPLRPAPYAIPSMLLGLASLVSCGFTGPAGLGLGIAALKQIQANPASYGGRALAISGIITGALGTLWILFVIVGLSV